MNFYGDGTRIVTTDNNICVMLAPVEKEGVVFFLLQGPSETDLEIICSTRLDPFLCGEIYKLIELSIPDDPERESVPKRNLFAAIRRVVSAIETLQKLSVKGVTNG